MVVPIFFFLYLMTSVDSFLCDEGPSLYAKSKNLAEIESSTKGESFEGVRTIPEKENGWLCGLISFHYSS